MNSYLEGYEKYRGDYMTARNGSMISTAKGSTRAYGLSKLESRGILFVQAITDIYEGMVFGLHSKLNDLDCNPCKEKALTNTRTTSKDESTKLAPITSMTLDRAIEFIKEDEVIEITPKNIRIRKKILNQNLRKSYKLKRIDDDAWMQM